MNTGKLIIGVALGVLLAIVVAYVGYQAVQPQDCALQRLEVQNGDRLEGDLSDACR